MLNTYFEVVVPPVVRRHGGDVDRIIGDALMVTFNKRGDQPDHAARAAAAGLALQEAAPWSGRRIPTGRSSGSGSTADRVGQPARHGGRTDPHGHRRHRQRRLPDRGQGSRRRSRHRSGHQGAPAGRGHRVAGPARRSRARPSRWRSTTCSRCTARRMITRAFRARTGCSCVGPWPAPAGCENPAMSAQNRSRRRLGALVVTSSLVVAGCRPRSPPHPRTPPRPTWSSPRCTAVAATAAPRTPTTSSS